MVEPVEDISVSWVNENNVLKNLEAGYLLSEFLEKTKGKNTSNEFRVMCLLHKILSHMTETTSHVQRLYKNEIQLKFNRYLEIIPYQHTIVKLDGPDVQNNYINANFIKVSQQVMKIPQVAEKIIATQGPLGSTVQQFWRMIDQHNIGVIFMLCQLEQKGKVQCFRYWPDQNEPDRKRIVGDYEIMQLSKICIQQDLYQHKFRLKNLLKDTEKQVTHYKFRSWPDHEAPGQKSFETIKKLLVMAIHMIRSEYRLVIHCSAGVGRTGTFIALISLILEIEDIRSRNEANTSSISVFKTVRQLKQQRWGMVNRQQQYAYIYQFLKQYLENDCC